ncbi:MAG TPA: type IV pilus modification protein PilV [Burkholderiales bacterium]|nr:type IV pilus modification protein PilV [Burkholderiales bacterium]
MKKQMQGVMLLEALIGILIFSIGILGLVGLQSTSIKNTTEARYRSEAAYLANQIVGRMWSDRTNLASYALATSTTCTAGASALQTWLCQVETNLPGITAAANRPEIVVAADQVTITLRWQLPGSDARRYTVVTRIN